MANPNSRKNQTKIWAELTSDKLPIEKAYKVNGLPILAVNATTRPDFMKLAQLHRQGVGPDFDYDWATALHGDSYSILLKVRYDPPNECEFTLVFTMPNFYNYLQAVAEHEYINLVSNGDYLFSMGINTTGLKGVLNMATVFLMAKGVA